MTGSSRILAFIEGCIDAQQLENLLTNARRGGEAEIEQLAFRRLIALGSKHEPGSGSTDLELLQRRAVSHDPEPHLFGRDPTRRD